MDIRLDIDSWQANEVIFDITVGRYPGLAWIGIIVDGLAIEITIPMEAGEDLIKALNANHAAWRR